MEDVGVYWVVTVLNADGSAPPVEAASIAISPADPVVYGAESIQLSATVRDAGGAVIPGASVSWSYDPTQEAFIWGCSAPPQECGSLSANGLFTAKRYTGSGELIQMIIAQSGSASDKVWLTIRPARTTTSPGGGGSLCGHEYITIGTTTGFGTKIYAYGPGYSGYAGQDAATLYVVPGTYRVEAYLYTGTLVRQGVFTLNPCTFLRLAW